MNNERKATIELSGIGRVFVDTSRKTIGLARGVTRNGILFGVTTRKVSRDMRHVAEAEENDAAGYWLKKVKIDPFGNEVFMIMRLD